MECYANSYILYLLSIDPSSILTTKFSSLDALKNQFHILTAVVTAANELNMFKTTLEMSPIVDCITDFQNTIEQLNYFLLGHRVRHNFDEILSPAKTLSLLNQIIIIGVVISYVTPTKVWCYFSIAFLFYVIVG